MWFYMAEEDGRMDLLTFELFLKEIVPPLGIDLAERGKTVQAFVSEYKVCFLRDVLIQNPSVVLCIPSNAQMHSINATLLVTDTHLQIPVDNGYVSYARTLEQLIHYTIINAAAVELQSHGFTASQIAPSGSVVIGSEMTDADKPYVKPTNYRAPGNNHSSFRG